MQLFYIIFPNKNILKINSLFSLGTKRYFIHFQAETDFKAKHSVD